MKNNEFGWYSWFAVGYLFPNSKLFFYIGHEGYKQIIHKQREQC